MSGTKKIRRGIMSALAPLTGSLASGTIVATASSGQGSVTVPRNSHLVPIYTSTTEQKEIDWDRPFYTTSQVSVLEAGTEIPIESVTGGARMNLPDDCELRWDPQLTGLEPLATVTGGPCTGGVDAVAGTFVRAIVAFETLESLAVAQDLFAAQVGELPSIVVAYGGSPRGQRMGDDSYWRPNRWRIYVVTQWGGATEAMGNEATDILDKIEQYLVDRTSSHGMVWSSPGGEVVARTRVRITPTSFVWAVDYETYIGVKRTEVRVDGVDYADWLRINLGMETAEPLPLPLLTDALYPAGQAEFDRSAFDNDAFHV